MSKKYQLDGTVIKNEWVTSTYFKMTLSFETLPEIKAGQFAELRIDETPTVFLRRPISLHDVREDKKELDLLIQKVGDGTAWLSTRKEGDKVNVVFPLGNGFNTDVAEDKPVLLVGGGVGIAPLLHLGRVLSSKGKKVHFLLGFRKEADILPLDAYKEVGEVFITTEDGSVGDKGFVTNHSLWNNADYARIFSCGPTPMMKALAKVAREKNIDCEVSLENKMACGVGACLCCVTQTHEGHKCVCTDGPVFNINELPW
ncbi:MAG: dihydroorotate dehydrogenase electron transfer subunit [Paludibacteraceae bacterium]|jgi:dihydroorotate dehydrogenase electron transfer subunit|nr:dihydroorotate dehydrogenase electron transfer subunit [Paludibacteraceae bacterium]